MESMPTPNRVTKTSAQTLCVGISPSSFADEDQTPLRLLEEAGVSIKMNPLKRRLTEDEILEFIKGLDGLLAGLEPLSARVLSSAVPRLRAIARVGAGLDNVDLEAARALGIKVSNTPDAPSDAVAEMTLAAMLCLIRGLVPADRALHARQWKKRIGRSLMGMTVLIIGYGRIGRRVGTLVKNFGADILVHDPAVSVDHLYAGETWVSLEEGLIRADLITLHASGNECILDAAAFQKMRDGVYLLNGARGGLVDEQALIEALDSGKVAGAWFDTFVQEPYAGPLCDYDNVLLTPHVATYTRECRRAMETAAVRNLLRDLGVPLR